MKITQLDHGHRLELNGRTYLSGDRVEKEKYIDILYQLGRYDLKPNSSIAMIGGGTSYLQTMLSLKNDWGQKDVYEIHEELKWWNDQNTPKHINDWNWIIGDWKETISGLYDVIIYDADEEKIDKKLLQKHSTGIILYYLHK